MATAGPSGPVVPGYELQALVGQGGMGQVYRALRLVDGSRVAVKVLTPAVEGETLDRYLTRFWREVAVCKKLNHPNVLPLLDTGCAAGSGHPFLVTEFLDGHDLEHDGSYGALGE